MYELETTNRSSSLKPPATLIYYYYPLMQGLLEIGFMPRVVHGTISTYQVPSSYYLNFANLELVPSIEDILALRDQDGPCKGEAEHPTHHESL